MHLRPLFPGFVPSLLLLGVLAPPGRAGEPPSPATLVPLLGHEDPYVRREAARALVRMGSAAEAAVEDAARAASRPGGQDLVRAAEAAAVGRALALARRLGEADPDRPGFWMALEEVLSRVPEALRSEVLAAGLGGPDRAPEVLARRDAARATVAEFVRDWNEWTEGSGEKERYDALRARLEGVGPPAVPHLLRVLDVDPRRAFAHLDPPPPGEVSARMQVRAIFGVSFLRAREALPHLLVHCRGPSLTASSNAGAAFLDLAGIAGGPTPPLVEPDLAKVDAWWAAHRGEFGAESAGLVRALLEALRTAVARDVAGITVDRGGTITLPLPREFTEAAQHQAYLVVLLGLVTGAADLAFDAAAPPAKRLEQARALAARLLPADLPD